MSVSTFEIDGKTITAAAGQTIFDAAWDSGVHIPRLCHLGGLSDVGACRLCLVEIEGQKKLQPSCLTRVTDDMVVRTDTPQLREYRKLIVELLFAERNHVCSVCVLNGACELQAVAADLGVDHIRLDPQYPHLSVDISHERFGLDHNRCILCTRCVRVCAEVEGARVWDVSGRGIRSMIVCDMSRPWGESPDCTNCGKCVQVCPTGALAEKGFAVEEMVKQNRSVRRLAARRGERP